MDKYVNIPSNTEKGILLKQPIQDNTNISTIENSFKQSAEEVLKNELKISPKLPKIYLPKTKISTFIDWYNKDLRFELEVPHAFEEGYFILENDFINDFNKNTLRNLLKNECKEELSSRFKDNKDITFNELWNFYYKLIMNTFIENSNHIILYFKFISKDAVKMKLYLANGSKIIEGEVSFNKDEKTFYDNKTNELSINSTLSEDRSIINCTLGNASIEINLDNWWINKETYTQFISEFYRIISQLFGCTMWYLSTSTNTTKYIYDNYKRNKNIETVVRDPQKIKTKSTPIYDMTKIREIKVEGLIKRRKGWTYSHSFQVHGHYRHYKNGKTVFIQPYIKGKEKEFQQQNIIINPKEG